MFSAIASAQQSPWSLESCVQYALDHNLTVKQSENVVAQREIELNTAKNSVWPAVQASASQNFSFGRGLSEDNTYVSSNTANTSFGLGGSMNLFTGLRVKNNITMGKLNLEAANADCDKAKEDIRIAVTQAYMQILYNMELCKVAELQIVIDSTQVERLTALRDAGKIGPAEVSSRKSTLAQSRVTLTQARNNLSIAILEMTQLLELPSPEGFEVAVPDAAVLEPEILSDPEQIFAQAVTVGRGGAHGGGGDEHQAGEGRLVADVVDERRHRHRLLCAVGPHLERVRVAVGRQLQPVCGVLAQCADFQQVGDTQQCPDGQVAVGESAVAVGERPQSVVQGDPTGLLQRGGRPREVAEQRRGGGERPRELRVGGGVVRGGEEHRYGVQRSEEQLLAGRLQPCASPLRILLPSAAAGAVPREVAVSS